MKPFISCNNPVLVRTSKGSRYVNCGHCVQCINAKRKKLNLLLDLEIQNCKYCEFITLTYSDEFLPYLDFNTYFDNMLRYGLNVDVLPVHLGNRVSYSFGRPVPDKSALDVVIPFSIISKNFNQYALHDSLSSYNKRVDAYFELFPYRKRGVRLHNVVPILWYSDLQKFIKRLRAFCSKKYGASFRYFAIGEYGTHSLRPHWHIVLLHNSLRLRDSFNDVVSLPQSTPQNPRECASEIFDSSLWTYGDCTTKTTDGRVASYISSYVNQSADFPAILNAFPQKEFHSIHLGEQRSYEQIANLFGKGLFEELCTSYLKDSKGIVRPVSVPSSTYDRFNLRLSGFDIQDYKTAYALFSSCKLAVKKYLESTGEILNIYSETSLYDFYLFLGYTLLESQGVLRDYYYNVIRPSFVERRTLNSLYLLLYGLQKLYKMSEMLGFSPYQYLVHLSSFNSWLSLKRLNELFGMLECDSNFSYQYYAALDPYTGVYDLNKLFTSPLYRQQVNNANMDYYEDIKHREVVDLYKN